MTERDFHRYLRAKRTVDDRAIDRGVLDGFRRGLADRADSGLDVLEVGVGLGDSILRFIEREVFPSATHVEYVGVDRRPSVLRAARRNLRSNPPAGWTVADAAGSTTLVGPSTTVTVELVAVDAFALLDGSPPAWDAIVAQSLLDLVDPTTAVPVLVRSLRPGGLAYFPLTFDGGTIFRPTIDPVLDRRIVDAYHRTMDLRVERGRPAGTSQAGRWLLEHGPDAGAHLVAAAGSDWIVHPGPDGYPADEAAFLDAILRTIRTALQDGPGGTPDSTAIDRWTARRRRQLASGRLRYIAHQLDVLCVRRESDAR